MYPSAPIIVPTQQQQPPPAKREKKTVSDGRTDRALRRIVLLVTLNTINNPLKLETELYLHREAES